MHRMFGSPNNCSKPSRQSSHLLVGHSQIDPRMLDPKCVFEQVEGDSTGGGAIAGTKQFNIFHKNWDAKRRQRDGYDMSRLDASMRHIEPISEFIKGKKDPIEMLSTCTGFSFTKDCQFFLNHRSTSSEIKACVSDLKVLNKSDFKGLLTWRTKMQDALKEQREKEDVSSDKDASDDDSQGQSGKNEINSDQEEEEIQAEIADMRRRRLREKKKIKKKERLQMAKRRKKAALGMDLNAVDVPEHDEIFSLATITSKGALEVAREVDLGKVTDEQLAIGENDDNGPIEGVNSDGEVESQGEEDDLDENTGYSYRLDRELDSAYDTYLEKTKNGLAKSGTKMGKRSKKLQRQKAVEEANEDTEMMLTNEEGIDNDTKTYAKMLQGPKDSDDEDSNDDSSDEEDDGFNDEPLTPAEHAAKKKVSRKEPGAKKPKEESNPLIYKLPEDPKSVKTARWFSNPLFESLGNTAQLAAMAPGNGSSKQMSNVDDYDSEDSQTGEDVMSVNSDTDASSDDEAKNSNSKGISADEVLASMPKTDKQVRHEKRLKSLERLERKKARRVRQAGETDADFEVAPGAAELGDEILKQDEKLDGLSVEQKKKVLEARALIKAGMGASTEEGGSGFEVVPATDNKRPLPIMDHRKYDSENEDYDSDDYAQTLALGTMMLRQSKAKALVDASYNRFAWNDPGDLPDWFVDDENKHYRPQLPVPPALLAKMKEKVMALAVRPIAKVAEARARKSKRARLKLTAAKKKAEAVAANSDMSETMKLKAISKAMRGQDSQRSGSKKYAVAKKGVQGSKGVKTLDKRMKSDKRGLERAEKRKNGSRSKKRRR